MTEFGKVIKSWSASCLLKQKAERKMVGKTTEEQTHQWEQVLHFRCCSSLTWSCENSLVSLDNRNLGKVSPSKPWRLLVSKGKSRVNLSCFLFFWCQHQINRTMHLALHMYFIKPECFLSYCHISPSDLLHKRCHL